MSSGIRAFLRESGQSITDLIDVVAYLFTSPIKIGRKFDGRKRLAGFSFGFDCTIICSCTAGDR